MHWLAGLLRGFFAEERERERKKRRKKVYKNPGQVSTKLLSFRFSRISPGGMVVVYTVRSQHTDSLQKIQNVSGGCWKTEGNPDWGNGSLRLLDSFDFHFSLYFGLSCIHIYLWDTYEYVYLMFARVS